MHSGDSGICAVFPWFSFNCRAISFFPLVSGRALQMLCSLPSPPLPSLSSPLAECPPLLSPFFSQYPFNPIFLFSLSLPCSHPEDTLHTVTSLLPGAFHLTDPKTPPWHRRSDVLILQRCWAVLHLSLLCQKTVAAQILKSLQLVLRH